MSEVGRRRDGREEVVRRKGDSWASSQHKKADFQEGGMINYQMSPVKEREAQARARVSWSRAALLSSVHGRWSIVGSRAEETVKARRVQAMFIEHLIHSDTLLAPLFASFFHSFSHQASWMQELHEKQRQIGPPALIDLIGPGRGQGHRG